MARINYVELPSKNFAGSKDFYAKAFGWDTWPASQLEQMRVDSSGRRGDGPLYAMGLNFSMTGVFYNKDLAAKFGMTSAPTTLAELDADLKKAKDAGLTPAAQFNGGATGGQGFPGSASLQTRRLFLDRRCESGDSRSRRYFAGKCTRVTNSASGVTVGSLS